MVVDFAPLTSPNSLYHALSRVAVPPRARHGSGFRVPDRGGR